MADIMLTTFQIHFSQRKSPYFAFHFAEIHLQGTN